MKANTLMRCFREAWRSLGRNGLMTLASVGTVTVSLLVLGSFFLLATNLNHAAGRALGSVYMRVILSDDADFNATERIRTWLGKQEGVARCSFVSREDAMKRLENMYGRHDGLFQEGDEQILPESFDVSLTRDANPRRMAAGLRRLAGVSEVLYGQDFYSKMSVVARLAWIGGMIVFGLIAFGVLFIITNTIRLTLLARRREIEIMGLVGATDWYIRWPFLFEGLLIGTFGAIIAAILLSRGYYFLVKRLTETAPFLNLLRYREVQTQLTWAVLGAGALFGLVASTISIKRFLRAA